MPPKGFIGLSNGSSFKMSFPLAILLPSNSATNGCGIACTHSSQCLYIRSFTIIPLDLGKSGCLSTVRSPYFTSATNSSFDSSGENEKSFTPPSRSVICWRALPSLFIIQSCIVPLSDDRKAICSLSFIHFAEASRTADSVICFLSDPSAFITKSSEFPLSSATE